MSLFGCKKCPRKEKISEKDSNSCFVHTQLLWYNTECVYKQLATTTTSLISPPTIAGQVGGQVNTALNLVNKELSQQCFRGIQLLQPLSWTYLLEVLPLLSENFYHYAINNFNLQRIILSVCRVLVFGLASKFAPFFLTNLAPFSGDFFCPILGP